MICYHVECKNVIAFREYIKNHLTEYSIWEPPIELFENCIFLETNEPLPVKSRYKFKKLTPDLYREITEESVGVEPPENLKDIIKTNDKVSVISPTLSFYGIVHGISDGLVNVSGTIKVGNKEKKIEVTVPIEFVSKKRRYKK